MLRSIIVPIESLPRVYRCAERARVTLSTHEIPECTLSQWIQEEIEVRAHLDLPTESEVALATAAAQVRASLHRLIEIEDVPQDSDQAQVIAWAERAGANVLRFDHGRTLASPSYWETHKDHDVDFTRCDVCNTFRRRHTVYMVRQRGKEMQVGGSCAEEMQVASLIHEYRRRVESFHGSLESDGAMVSSVGKRSKSPRLIFAICVEVLRMQRGFISRKAADERDVPSTSRLVKEILSASHDPSLLMPNLRRCLNRAIDSCASGAAQVALDACIDWLTRHPMSEGDIGRNAIPALTSGSVEHAGLTAYCVSAFLRAQVAQRIQGRIHCYLAPSESRGTLAHLDSVAAECGVSSQELLGLIGANAPKKSTAKVKGLDRVIPGVWCVMHISGFPTEYGWTDRIRLTRVADGATVSWMTSAAPAGITVGDECLILSASVGEVQPDHPRFGCNGTRVSRVSLHNLTLTAHKALFEPGATVVSSASSATTESVESEVSDEFSQFV